MTNCERPTAEADITHRKHAIIGTTFADLSDGPLVHIPSGLFSANCARLACAVMPTGCCAPPGLRFPTFA